MFSLSGLTTLLGNSVVLSGCLYALQKVCFSFFLSNTQLSCACLRQLFLLQVCCMITQPLSHIMGKYRSL